MDTLAKLEILADAAKYDAACTSSGVERGPQRGMLGVASNAGCCHSFTADGRCVTLLKVLLSNACTHDCAYCVNRVSNHVPRATFEPHELAELTVSFYKRNYIEGLFLSSGVLGTPDATSERMIECLELLRGPYRFGGYVHAKVIPGTHPDLIDRLGRLADRLSCNVELPSAASLERLCPEKRAEDVIAPMAQIQSSMASGRLLGSGATSRGDQVGAGSVYSTVKPARGELGSAPSLARRKERPRERSEAFCPAGQSTQLIIGATPETDQAILQLSTGLYRRFGLKRVFFSAYMPIVDDPRLPHPETEVPLRREHRLYQADWLMRFYGFEARELVADDAPFLDLDVDPKLAWALSAPDRFPVEVNAASREELLRVPGFGPASVRKICRARRSHALTFDDLDRLRISLKRAGYFITCQGQRSLRHIASGEAIREKVVSDARSSAYNRAQRHNPRQLTLF